MCQGDNHVSNYKQHRDPKSKKRMLSRVPLANIVQTLEELPEKAS